MGPYAFQTQNNWFPGSFLCKKHTQNYYFSFWGDFRSKMFASTDMAIFRLRLYPKWAMLGALDRTPDARCAQTTPEEARRGQNREYTRMILRDFDFPPIYRNPRISGIAILLKNANLCSFSVKLPYLICADCDISVGNQNLAKSSAHNLYLVPF